MPDILIFSHDQLVLCLDGMEIPTASIRKQVRAHVALLTGMRNNTGPANKLSTK
jgi:hypothetical protein